LQSILKYNKIVSLIPYEGFLTGGFCPVPVYILFIFILFRC
jgi:hypothetical protein